MIKEASNLVVVLDIGTSKTVAAVAESGPDGQLDVIGLGQAASTGMRAGVLVNIDATVESIRQAVALAEERADCKIKSAYIGICGTHIETFNSTGMVAIKDREVSKADVERVMETAKAVTIAHDKQLLHVIPQEFIIDGSGGIQEPIGMSGKRFEVRAHIAIGSVSMVENVQKCVLRQGIEVSDSIFSPFASAEAVLSADEKRHGAVLVDIGAGTTDVSIYSEGAVRHTAVLPIAGRHISADLGMAFRTPVEEAELLKIAHGAARRDSIKGGGTVSVPGITGQNTREVPLDAVADVIEARLEELFHLIGTVIVESELANVLPRGIVITGGTALLPGIAELATTVLSMPARIGVPDYVGLDSELVCKPEYSAVMGLLKEGQRQLIRHDFISQRSGLRHRFWESLKNFVVGNF